MDWALLPFTEYVRYLLQVFKKRQDFTQHCSYCPQGAYYLRAYPKYIHLFLFFFIRGGAEKLKQKNC